MFNMNILESRGTPPTREGEEAKEIAKSIMAVKAPYVLHMSFAFSSEDDRDKAFALYDAYMNLFDVESSIESVDNVD